jgi:hypothetical protein
MEGEINTKRQGEEREGRERRETLTERARVIETKKYRQKGRKKREKKYRQSDQSIERGDKQIDKTGREKER